ncbi:MAG TPA: 16S rRNA (guanine(527)-N(7))-methyltransferase RsmG, partial [Noviherbaspirillum sp.]|nr:16S rRNA (guanine(527)-N(7))-methyltransferase RsmG [Noviherbaspirillum sp.]
MSSFDRAHLTERLRAGVDALQLQLDDGQIGKLIDYLGLLAKWNAVYNLTAVRDPAQMVVQHLLDSLAAVPAFAGAHNVLDVGAGGGLPGIVLAIARPEMQLTLVDTVHKKTAFLTQVKAELGLANVSVHHARVEQMQVAQKFDVITSRAFAELNDFVTWSGHLLADGGCFIALKGVRPDDEVARLPAGWKLAKLVPLDVPGLGA